MFARQKRLKVEFRNVVSMSPGLAGIIEQLLEPAPEDRFQVILFSLLQGGLHLLLNQSQLEVFIIHMSYLLESRARNRK